MKLLLLHGAAKASSRKKLIEIKQKFDPNNVVVFEEGSTTKDIIDNLMSTSLFGNERLVVLENPDDADFLPTTTYHLPPTLLLWFDHEVGGKKPIMELVNKAKGEILYFPESKEISVFPFLDLLAQGNMKAFLEIKKLKDTGYDIFYFNIMVIYLLRNLINTPRNASHSVADKLRRQRVRLNQKRVINLYKDILEIDFKLKSGLIEKDQAEFMLVNKFL